MGYDAERISWIVYDKRKAFFIRFFVIIILMLSAFIVSILNISDRLTVISALLEFPLILILAGVIKKYDAKTLISKEVIGKNIKEHEYTSDSTNMKGAYRRINVAHTFANVKPSHVRLSGTVYLKLDDGNVIGVSGLNKSHMDIYEDGDLLHKYAGTKYPVVVSREIKKQPCPICGEVNDMTLDECSNCGLTILKRK